MDNGTSPVGTRRNWLKIGFAVSVALNLAVLGLVAGAAWRHDGFGPSRGPSLAGFGGPYMMALSREDRREIFRVLREEKGVLPDRAARRALFQDALAAIEASPFDAERLAATISRQAEVSVNVQKHAQDAWLARVGQMNDAERMAYAQDVRERMRRGPRKPDRK